MRTFDERLAEIRRRSEKIKIQRKRRRKYILTGCVPLLLCISLSLALSHQRTGTNIGEAAPEAMQDTTVPAMFFSYLCSVSRIDISGPEISLSLTDPAEIEKVTDHLLRCGVDSVETYSASGSITDKPHSNESATEPATRGDGIPGSMLDTVSRSYTLTLTVPGEAPVQYCLSQNTLKNLSSGELHTLTQSQTTVLHHLLGLPQP